MTDNDANDLKRLGKFVCDFVREMRWDDASLMVRAMDRITGREKEGE